MVSRMTEPILTYANTEGQGEWMWGWGSTALAPPGATLSGSAERQPSEIPCGLDQCPRSFSVDPRRVPAPPATSALNLSPALRNPLMLDYKT